jgi:hypothetical protein
MRVSITKRGVLLAAVLTVTIAGLSFVAWRRLWAGEPDFVFRPVSKPATGVARLFQLSFKDEPDQSKDYPASFTSVFDRECSATLVGPDTVLTAEHCVRVAAEYESKIKIEFNGEEISTTCSALGKSQVALCKLDKPIDGVPFEILGDNIELARPGTEILLTGWGDPWSWSQWLHDGLTTLLRYSKPFRVGNARIVSGSAELVVEGRPASGGYVVLEPGDSGGAAFVRTNNHRLVIGINECGGKGCRTTGHEATSAVTSIVFSDHHDLAMSWACKKKARVCGLTPAEGCRSQ